MGEVCLALSMSLDGYVANVGDDVALLDHDNMSLSRASRSVVHDHFEQTGACVAGRATFEVSGRRGGQAPFPMPYFIVAHDVPAELTGPDERFTFVTDGVERAVELARAAAGGKKVGVMGADVPKQAVRAGLLDEVLIHLVPVLLGGGKRLFEHLGGQAIALERTQVVAAPDGITHLRFRIGN